MASKRKRAAAKRGAYQKYTVKQRKAALRDAEKLGLRAAAAEHGGKRVSINRVDRDFRHWKRYTDGTAAQISVGDLEGGSFCMLTTFKGNNAYTMWHGGRIYFLSDRTGTMKIWSMSPAGSDLRQHRRFEDYDVRFPSLGQGMIAFQQRAEIYLLYLESGAVRPVRMTILSDALCTRVSFTDPAKLESRRVPTIARSSCSSRRCTPTTTSNSSSHAMS